MMRAIVNCSRGWSSIANSALVVVPLLFHRASADLVLAWPPIADRDIDAGNRAIDVQHAGGDAEEEQHDHPPRPGAEPAVDRPAQPGRDPDCNDQLDADAKTKSKPLLHSRTVDWHRFPVGTLCPGSVDALAQPLERVRRLLAHSKTRRNIETALKPVNEAPSLGTSRF